jgi:hypothetical protein
VGEEVVGENGGLAGNGGGGLQSEGVNEVVFFRDFEG